MHLFIPPLSSSSCPVLSFTSSLASHTYNARDVSVSDPALPPSRRPPHRPRRHLLRTFHVPRPRTRPPRPHLPLADLPRAARPLHILHSRVRRLVLEARMRRSRVRQTDAPRIRTDAPRCLLRLLYHPSRRAVPRGLRLEADRAHCRGAQACV